jgi:hypothetical protein
VVIAAAVVFIAYTIRTAGDRQGCLAAAALAVQKDEELHQAAVGAAGQNFSDLHAEYEATSPT